MHHCVMTPSKQSIPFDIAGALSNIITNEVFIGLVGRKLREDKIGKIARSQTLILYIGQNTFEKTNNAKPVSKIRRAIALTPFAPTGEINLTP